MASIVFPRDLSSYSFWFKFDFYQYNVPIGGGQSGVSPNTPAVVLSSLGTVRLPMPNSMVDHQDVVYAVEDLGMVAGAALAKFQQTGSWAGAAGAGATGAGIGGLVNAGNAALPGGTAGGANILLQTQGLAVNPFLSVMFKSPAFKKHAFKWKLTPTNEAESADLNTIVNTFRFNQLPSATTAFSGALLAYPNIVQVTVAGSVPPQFNGTSMFSYTFKPAVIESFAVNFTPSGQPSFFGSTDAPTEVEMSMSLLEIEYWLQNDYGMTTTRGNSSAADISNWISRISGQFGNIWKNPSDGATGSPDPLPPLGPGPL